MHTQIFKCSPNEVIFSAHEKLPGLHNILLPKGDEMEMELFEMAKKGLRGGKMKNEAI